MIHKKFPGNTQVIAIGDAFNDIEMLSQANIAI
jgi:hydroxymethylpyrimidine pyrophosphatase-like HAD family hydrolase